VILYRASKASSSGRFFLKKIIPQQMPRQDFLNIMPIGKKE
jgi:hypothetical protein